MSSYRTETCGALRPRHVGERARLAGWVHRKRDHGGLLFIDLRDHYGLTQCVVEPESPVFEPLTALRAESVITVEGLVASRPAETVNPELATGEVELRVTTFELLSAAEELPLPVFGDQEYPEETRLTYRYLDLRRERMHQNIMLRAKVIASIRKRMIEAGFTEFQTPILTASSPEGARDFLVPSRLHPGKFYALPQAPQQFKQLVMAAGFDKYFQIAPCFRDEDARADRSPGEFYQLDVEMSFVAQDDVFATMEPILRGVLEEFGEGKPVTQKFPRIPFREALLKYGTDKPDLRNPIVIADVTKEFMAEGVTFNAFRKVIEAGGVVRAIPAPGAAAQPRSFFDKLNDWAREEMAAPGLGYIVFEEGYSVPVVKGKVIPEKGRAVVISGGDLSGIGSGKGPIAKFIPVDIQRHIAAKAGINSGDAVFFAADKADVAATLAGAARTRIGRELGLVAEDRFELCWIVDYPMYEWNDKEKKIDFSHNPFSMPQGGLEALTKWEPLDILAFQYDIVCNGVELSSGAIRNHRPDVMVKAFEIAGYGRDEVEKRFGGLFNAFHYGAPPHGGIAPGIDRIVMLLAGVENIREVTLFPMNQQAQDLMMGAPSEVPSAHLRELHLRLALPPKAPER